MARIAIADRHIERVMLPSGYEDHVLYDDSGDASFVVDVERVTEQRARQWQRGELDYCAGCMSLVPPFDDSACSDCIEIDALRAVAAAARELLDGIAGRDPEQLLEPEFEQLEKALRNVR